MRITILVILIASLACSCNRRPNTYTGNYPDSSRSEIKIVGDSINDISRLRNQLADIFKIAVNAFPEDSASLHRFYFERHPPQNDENIKRQIDRLRALTAAESVRRYNSVSRYLRPLLVRIVNSNTISKSQLDSLTTLYSDYDYFTGEALLSKLLGGDDNYGLVWPSVRLIVEESKEDTCYISALTTLDLQIRTNVELAEEIPVFIVQAIRNNPIGFLEMYGARTPEVRSDFANYISVYDEPDTALIATYVNISENSVDSYHRRLAQELVLKFN